MDRILLILIIIIFILVCINLYKDSLETFTEPPLNNCESENILDFTGYKLNSSVNCQFVFNNEDNLNTDQKIKNYTISLLFKPNQNSGKQYLLTYNKKWCVYIEQNKLYLTDYKETRDPFKSVSTDLYKKTNYKLYDLQSLGNERKYYHLAIIVKENKTFLFLNGEKGYINIENDIDTSFKKIKRNITLGNKDSKSFFMGTILNLEFFTEAKNEDELCANLDSCDLCNYSLEDNITYTENECVTECSKMCSDSECITKCKDWKPKCVFDPSGNTLSFCKSKCMDDILNSCRYDECLDKCNNCKDIIKCPWNKFNDFKNTNTHINNKEILPPTLEFEVFSNNLKIKLNHPLKYGNPPQYDDEIEMFIIFIKKLNKTNEGQRIIPVPVDEKYKTQIIKYNKNDNNRIIVDGRGNKWVPFHYYTLKNLDKDDEYIISCKSVKKKPSPSTTTRKYSSESMYSISDLSIKYNIVLSSYKGPIS